MHHTLELGIVHICSRVETALWESHVLPAKMWRMSLAEDWEDMREQEPRISILAPSKILFVQSTLLQHSLGMEVLWHSPQHSMECWSWESPSLEFLLTWMRALTPYPSPSSSSHPPPEVPLWLKVVQNSLRIIFRASRDALNIDFP